MDQISPSVQQLSFSQMRKPTGSGDLGEVHLGSPPGATRYKSRFNVVNTHDFLFHPGPNVVSNGAITSATNNVLLGSRGLLASTNIHHSGDNSDDESDSGWGHGSTVSGATTFIAAPFDKHKVPSSLFRPIRRHKRRSTSLVNKSLIDVKTPSPVSRVPQLGSSTDGRQAGIAAARQRFPRRAFHTNLRIKAISDGTPFPPAPLYKTQTEASALPASKQLKQKLSGIPFARIHYTISQDHTDSEDARRSGLLASFRRPVQKQPGIQAAPTDLFNADTSLTTSFDGGGLELGIPVDTGNALTDFDFDSFLSEPILGDSNLKL